MCKVGEPNYELSHDNIPFLQLSVVDCVNLFIRDSQTARIEPPTRNASMYSPLARLRAVHISFACSDDPSDMYPHSLISSLSWRPKGRSRDQRHAV